MSAWLAFLPACGLEDAGTTEELACTPDDSASLYEQRIAPLLEQGRDSSCNECHLSGIDLGTFVRESPCASMACLAEQGLVDMDEPENSTILSWIERADPQSELVTAETIDEEYQGMLEWITFSARCGDEVCEPIENPCGEAPSSADCEIPPAAHDGASHPFDDPGDCSDKTLEAMFEAKVYSWRGRCNPCHFEDQQLDAPHWIEVGDCRLGSLQTLRNVERNGYIDVDDPTQSLLLLKPLGELEGGVDHGGGAKFQDVEEATYQDFLFFLERYASCQ